ncbi:hypothetical protein N5079_05330 [Planotetraspora sp. A-T 1434]|uniref:DUF7158 domain-containing protein n=1 Tax=Planotetraspora sp. A-T 1434 TaxID=2979219 RepID=UPI0021BEF2AC|nr:hypothetical protein [Planotetraspora sp. A-T 1434]MCT9929640.1 hypothetical protein [Planotetraspora sp. A-T 1434]
MGSAHSHGHGHRGTGGEEPSVAAYVGERAILVEDVEARVDALRRGPLAGRLPQPGTADGRNLRRWVVQVMTHEAVIEMEAAALGLSADPEDGGKQSLTLPVALRMGGVAAAVLASMPLARALRRRIGQDVAVPAEECRAYHERNRDRYAEPYYQVSNVIEAELREAAVDREFTAWLGRRHAALVRLMPGLEHPADPRHPDATHRH